MASSQIGGALPYQMPLQAPPKVGRTDKAIARSTSAKLTAAIKATNDPQLKAQFSQTLAHLNQYLAQDNKARKQASASKVSKAAEPKPAKKK